MQQNLDRFKFRIWAKKLKILLYDNTVATIECALQYKEDYILMQSTGLKDKNNKLIFEGDILRCDLIDEDANIVQHDEVLYLIGFQDGCFGTYFNYNKITKTGDDFEVLDVEFQKDFVNYEVVGNRFENPELVEKI